MSNKNNAIVHVVINSSILGKKSLNNKNQSRISIGERKNLKAKASSKLVEKINYKTDVGLNFLPAKLASPKPKNIALENRLNEINLWRAVILQALQDATSNSNKYENKVLKAKAIAWISSDSEDLQQVLNSAQISRAELFSAYKSRKIKFAI
jgi:hypothetical protein